MIERIHRYLEDWCARHISRHLATCRCNQPSFLACLVFRFVYSPVEFRLRKRIQAKRAALKRRKIPFFDMPLL